MKDICGRGQLSMIQYIGLTCVSPFRHQESLYVIMSKFHFDRKVWGQNISPSWMPSTWPPNTWRYNWHAYLAWVWHQESYKHMHLTLTERCEIKINESQHWIDSLCIGQYTWKAHLVQLNHKKSCSVWWLNLTLTERSKVKMKVTIGVPAYDYLIPVSTIE